MIELEPVSKCKKLASLKNRTTEAHIAGYNVTLIPANDFQLMPFPKDRHESTKRIGSMKETGNKVDAEADDEFAYKRRDFEDANLTKHISQKNMLLRVLMVIMGVLSIVLSRINAVIDSERRQHEYIESVEISDVILGFHSVITLSLMVLVLMRHGLEKRLVDKQLIKFSAIQINLGGVHKQLLLELFFLTLHPNLVTKNIQIKIKQPIYHQQTFTSLNSILEIFMLLRVYLIFSVFISSSIYMSTRGNRICRIYGTNDNLRFGMKCVFNSAPLWSLLVLFICSLYVFAEMVRISEGGVVGGQLKYFKNSLWCVMITMGTVGYGDYSPQTYFGRGILFLASVAGIILSSLLILTLSTDLSMRLSENKSHVTLQRLVLRESLEKLAEEVMYHSVLLSQKSKEEQKSKQLLKQLKHKADDVKYTLRKIKNIIDMDNINEEMDRLFEVLDDNMREAYINQVRYAEVLEDLSVMEEEKIIEMRFSFTDEIENVIKDR